MKVIVEISGRQAIPVRAIPLLTDWRGLSPDQLAKILTKDSDHWPSFDGLSAHRLHPDGSTKQIPPRWWASWVVRKLQATSDAIKAKQTSHETGYQQWRRESLAQLPAGVFVWRDEFEAAHAFEYGPEGMRARGNPKGFDSSAHTLDFNPHPDPAIATPQMVLEGFAPNGDAGDERLKRVIEWLNAPREVLTEQEAAEQEAAWFDATLDAAGFFALGHVSPVEAAMLLCRHNPHEVTEKDAEAITCDPNCSSEITPNDFKRLRRTFVDLDHAKPGSRPLVDWMRAAAGAGRRVHPWAHRYAEHRGLYGPEKEPAPAPIEAPAAPATDTAPPAPVVQATETKEQRQDRRLKACIDDGLPMDTKAALSRLPDGVGDVAGREGVTRQAFSTDVKAALKRRDNARREGKAVHCA